MVEAVFEPYDADDFPEPVAVDRAVRDLQRQQNVLLGRQRWHEVEGLEDEADLFAPQLGELLLLH